ncbi:MAG: DM13 domain-containing protein [Acidimicrobiia bacterium]
MTGATSRRRRRWTGAVVRAAAVTALVGAAYLVRPGPVRSTVRHPEALGRVGLLVLAWVGLGWVVRRLLAGRVAVQRLVMAVPAAVLVLMLIVPYASDQTVVEPFPVVAGPSPAVPAPLVGRGPTPAVAAIGGLSPAGSGPGPTAPGPTTTAPTEPLVPAGPRAPVVGPVVPAPEVLQPAAQPVPETIVAAPAPPTPAAPVALGAGSFVGIDHRAAGDVALYRLADGSVVVRLENVDIEPGPDYDLYLVAGAGRESPDGGARLGDLKGNKGDQNYPVAPGVPVDGELTVLVWCEVFSVPVAAATLS